VVASVEGDILAVGDELADGARALDWEATAVRAVQIEANGTAYGRNLIFHINQLGGVGAGNSMFNVPGSFVQKRGIRRMAPYPFDKKDIS
jgi:hypothetical protein